MTDTYFFVVCIRARDDLQLGKVYRATADEAAEPGGFVRVWDDSGEDYLYPYDLFVALDLGETERQRLEAALGA